MQTEVSNETNRRRLFHEENRGCRHRGRYTRINFSRYFCLLRISREERERGKRARKKSVLTGLQRERGGGLKEEANREQYRLVQPFWFFEKSLAEHLYTL